MKTIFHFNYHNTLFYGVSWTAPKGKAVVVLVHGMGSHSGRYSDSVIPKFIKNGYHVVAFDHFGHGKTEGKRGHNPGFIHVLNSIEKGIENAKKRFPNVPVFLYGHSMGGNAVINFVLKKQPNIQGVIATSPMLRLSMKAPKWKMILGKIAQKITPSLTMPSGLDVNAISRIPEAITKYSNDELVHNKISPNYSITFIKNGAWAMQNASLLKIPMLLLHGTDDRICSYKGSKDFAKNNTKVTLKLYEGGYHELHHDLCKKEMLNDIVKWMNAKK